MRGERYQRDATVALNGADIKVQVRDAANKVVQQTEYRRLTVDGPDVGSGDPVTVTGMRDTYHMGDPVRVSVGRRDDRRAGRVGVPELVDSMIHMQYGDVDGGNGANGVNGVPGPRTRLGKVIGAPMRPAGR